MFRVIAAAVLTVSFLLVAPAPAHAGPVGGGGPFGLGIILGNPSAVSGKYFLDRDHAVDFGVGFGWAGREALHLHADYLFHLTLVRPKPFELRFYGGIGGGFVTWFGNRTKHWGSDHRGTVGIGLRIPLGLAFHLRQVPLDPFIEVVPGLWILPGTAALVQGGVGVRYYF